MILARLLILTILALCAIICTLPSVNSEEFKLEDKNVVTIPNRNAVYVEAIKVAKHNQNMLVFGSLLAKMMKDFPYSLVDAYLDRQYHGQRRTVVQLEIFHKFSHLFITFAPAFKELKAEVKVRDLVNRKYLYCGQSPLLGAQTLIEWLELNQIEIDRPLLMEQLNKIS